MIDRIAELIVTKRAWVLVITLLLTGWAAALIPKTTADFTPSELFASFEDQERIQREFRDTFGNTDQAVLVMVESEDVWSVPALQYIHELSSAMEGRDWVGSVNSLTTLTLPVADEPASGTASQQEVSTEGEGSFGASILGSMGTTLSDIGAGLGLSTSEEGDDSGSDLLTGVLEGRAPFQRAIQGEEVEEAEAAYLRERIEHSSLLRRRLFSEDATLALVVVQLDDGITRNDQISAAVQELLTWTATNPPPPELSLDYGGLPYIRARIIDELGQDQKVMLPSSIVLCVLLLLLAYRWGAAMFLPTLAVAVAVVWLVGGMAAVGEPFNVLNNIIPLVVIIIGVSDSIHLLNRYLEEVRSGADRETGSKLALRSMLVACFLTSFTTSVGFATLWVASTDLLQRFGVTAALGVLAAYVTTILLIPAALPMVGLPKYVSSTESDRLEDLIEAATRKVLAAPWLTLAGGAIVLGVSVFMASSIRVDARLMDQFDPSHPVYAATMKLENKLVGVRPLELYFTSEDEGRFHERDVLTALWDVADWSRGQEGVLGVLHGGDFVAAIHHGRRGEAVPEDVELPNQAGIDAARLLTQNAEVNPLEAWISADGRRARVSLQLQDFGAERTAALVEQLDGYVRSAIEPLDLSYTPTGDAYTSSLGLRAVIGDLLSSLGLAVFIIFGFMTLLFRSFRLGLLSVPPNLTPLLFTLGLMAALGVELNAATVIIFSVSIGLAVDGTIHVLARVREELKEGVSLLDEAIVRSARGTGKAILLTSLALMLGFSIMLTSAFVPVQRFGLLIGITVLGCFISTVLLLPALLKLGWGPVEGD